MHHDITTIPHLRRPEPPNAPRYTLRQYSTQQLAYARPSTVNRYEVTSRIYPMQVYATPTRAMQPRPIGNVHRTADAIRQQLPTNPLPPPHQNIDAFDATPKSLFQSFNMPASIFTNESPNQTVFISTKTVTTSSSNNQPNNQPAVNIQTYQTTTTNYPNTNTASVSAFHPPSTSPPQFRQATPPQSQYAPINKQFTDNNNYVIRPLSRKNSMQETVVEWTEPYDSNNPPAPPPILDPRARIHDYATTTYVRDTNQHQPLMNQNISMHQRRSSPSRQHDLVKQLRDDGLTASQRFANQFQRSQRREDDLPFDVNAIIMQSYKGDQVDQLVHQMQSKLSPFANPMSAPESRSGSLPSGGRNSINSIIQNTLTSRSNLTSSSIGGAISLKGHMCVSCGKEITADKPGCTAMDQVYHVACFTCKKCQRVLAGASFYNIDNSPTCENCYMETLEKCTKCGETITDKLLRACGGVFHVQCFYCSACRKALDGIPFTVDADNNQFCVPCFHEKFAPRCAMCSKAIIPEEGQKESVRVVAMDRSYHPSCYKCEDCGLQLSSKIEGQGCYPLDSHLYCKTCNGNRLRMTAAS
ncbi:hypothetical protein WR25_03802 isoform A [Diploscapter pachys]|uniref:LIM zinc-binding domain-containing protein n=1 Tax=Diploscapter pachys TaxID=2018661 RepID=A0A2A2LND8_9BILA|nr:hypothetical protein WR25_03802 isoform A [Diploscapter pachys]